MTDDEVTLVVSDLHLGGEESLDDFYADDEFADFLRFHQARHARLHLVINGDWLDFLQIDPYPEKRARREDLEEIYPMRMTEDQAVAALERTIVRHATFFRALRDLIVQPASRITILRGNHDIELAFPAVQARIRAELGAPPTERLAFPAAGLWDRERGLYIEHGCQYDGWNSFARFDDPFLDRARRRLETPFGSVIVKTFWNRVEREFPYIDKIRPMSDSVAALLVQRPTYLLLKFDYFVDLALGAWAENLRTLFARRPRRALPPPEGTPEAAARSLWRRAYVGRLTGFILLAIFMHLFVQAGTVWMTSFSLGLQGVLAALHHIFARFGLELALSSGTIAFARLLRYLLWKAGARPSVRIVAYRLLVLCAALVFFEAIVRMFWLPLVAALGAYFLWDGVRTLLGGPARGRNRLLRRPVESDLGAATRILQEAGVRTVIFGHTHAPCEVTVEPGKRFINSGTWVKVVDLRHVRARPTELNTFVLVEPEGEAHLMCWRGSDPARRYVAEPEEEDELAAAG